MLIVAEILTAAEKGLAKTQIMYQANLSFKALNETFCIKQATQTKKPNMQKI